MKQVAREIVDASTVALARRGSFRDFISYTKPDFLFAPHHELIIQHVQDVLDGKRKRLYIGMPPRHGKSEIGSVRLPAFYLGLNPDKQIIHISYSADLSNDFSRQVRSLVRDSVLYRRLFPTLQLDPERQKLNDWKTTQGGGFKSIGVQGGVTGHGADLMIIDDPHKEGDADSLKTLDDVYNWYATAARTRLAPQAPVVFIMTRWHRLDLIGQLLELSRTDATADKWDELVLPAIAEEGDILGRKVGEALWAERFDEQALHAIRSLDERYFQALFQNNPRGADSALFNADDFKLFDNLDMDMSGAFWTFDLATSTKDTADYTVFARWKYDGDNLYCFNVTRVRSEFPELAQTILKLMDVYKHDVFCFPRHTVELLMMQQLSREGDGTRVMSVAQHGDKLERAYVLARMVRSGKVYVQKSGDYEHFISEHGNFPQARHDDCVDCSSIATHYIGLPAQFSASIIKQETLKQESVDDIFVK